MSAFAVSLLALAGCGVLIVGAALLRIYGAERRRRRRLISSPRRTAENEAGPQQRRG